MKNGTILQHIRLPTNTFKRPKQKRQLVIHYCIPHVLSVLVSVTESSLCSTSGVTVEMLVAEARSPDGAAVGVFLGRVRFDYINEADDPSQQHTLPPYNPPHMHPQIDTLIANIRICISSNPSLSFQDKNDRAQTRRCCTAGFFSQTSHARFHAEMA